LLAIVQQQGRVTPRAAQRSTGASINTIKAHLRQLVEQGHLQRLGVGRGTWYEIGRH
jgi:predicted HTH transcriptional regulator